MSTVIKPPQPPQPFAAGSAGHRKSVFLAGSIEMGRAGNWQQQFEAAFQSEDVVLLNPRRDDWDASWKQEISNPTFVEQVEWELTGLEAATVIAMYFEPATQSPITLLELGLWAQSGKLVVCCPEGFWRKGNVDVVCRRYGVPQVSSLPELIESTRQRLQAAS